MQCGIIKKVSCPHYSLDSATWFHFAQNDSSRLGFALCTKPNTLLNNGENTRTPSDHRVHWAMLHQWLLPKKQHKITKSHPDSGTEGQQLDLARSALSIPLDTLGEIEYKFNRCFALQGFDRAIYLMSRLSEAPIPQAHKPTSPQAMPYTPLKIAENCGQLGYL